jgi:hypothetical protein
LREREVTDGAGAVGGAITATPSELSCTSVSRKSRVPPAAATNAGIVFSGATERSPRCPAMKAGSPGARSAPIMFEA